MPRKRNILENRHAAKEPDVLKSAGHTQLRNRGWFVFVNGLAVEFDRALIRHINTGHEIKDGCFTRAIGPDESIKVSGIERHAEILDCDKTSKSLRAIPDFKNSHSAFQPVLEAGRS